MNITLQNICKSYGGKDILSDFSLDVLDGMRLLHLRSERQRQVHAHPDHGGRGPARCGPGHRAP